MPIRVVCPCGQKIDAAERFAGRSVKCPTCGAPLKIPAADLQPNVGTMEVLDMSDEPLEEKSALTLAPLEDAGSSAMGGLEANRPVAQQKTSGQTVGSAGGSAYAPPTRVIEEEEDDSPSAKTVLGAAAFIVLCLASLVGVVIAVVVWFPPAEQVAGEQESASKSSQSQGKAASASSPTETRASTTTGDAADSAGSPAAASSSSVGNNASSPDKLRNIFGYDKSKRTQLSEYLRLKGHSRGHIGVLNLKILGRLNGVCNTFDLKPDANNYVVFPEKAFPEYRERFDQGKLFEDEKLAQELPDLLQDLRKDYESGKLNEADRHLAFIVFSAFLLEKL